MRHEYTGRAALVPGNEDALQRRGVDADVGFVVRRPVVPASVDHACPVDPEHDRVALAARREHPAGDGAVACILRGSEERTGGVHRRCAHDHGVSVTLTACLP